MKRFLIVLFLGWAGVHKFIDKKIGMGILYLFTLGLFGFGWLYDIIKSAISLFVQSESNYISSDSIVETSTIKSTNSFDVTENTVTSVPEPQLNTDDQLVKPNITKIQLKKEKHCIAGTNYRQKEIQTLGTENYYYEFTKKELQEELLDGERIYEYEFFPSKIELIEEPDNEHDPNAIKLVIDNVHVGYIKAGSCSHVKKLLHGDKIDHLEADIKGGKYKYLEYDDYNDSYSLTRDKSNYYIDLYIYCKTE